MAVQPQVPDELLQLANQIFGFFAFLHQPMAQWVPYFLKPQYDDDFALKNKLTPILVCVILDMIEQADLKIPKLVIQAARAPNSIATKYYLEQASLYAAAAAQHLSVFSEEEMIVIREFRKAAVHGHLTTYEARRKAKYAVSCTRQGVLVRRQMSFAEYCKVESDYYARYASMDDALGPIRGKFQSERSVFWSAVASLGPPQLDAINDELLQRTDFSLLAPSFRLPAGIGTSIDDTRATVRADEAPNVDAES